jgi:hypothetical protein
MGDFRMVVLRRIARSMLGTHLVQLLPVLLHPLTGATPFPRYVSLCWRTWNAYREQKAANSSSSVGAVEHRVPIEACCTAQESQQADPQVQRDPFVVVL